MRKGELLCMASRGKFITFEGGEGVGKSTQIVCLQRYLLKQNREVVVTREPGGTPNSEAIRSLFLEQREKDPFDEITELLLVMAGRRDHLQKKILPALQRGAWVLCDRFIDSAAVYQGMMAGRSAEWVWNLHREADVFCVPDLTFVFHAPLDVLALRSKKRKKILDRFDQRDLSFHKRLAQAYETLAQTDARYHSVDTGHSVDGVTQEIIHEVSKRFL